MLTDPVYEGKSMAALIDLVRDGRIVPGSKVLYAHLGGQPALNGYAGRSSWTGQTWRRATHACPPCDAAAKLETRSTSRPISSSVL